MNNRFDELAKGMAQSVTRRQALKRFGVGLAGIVLACFGPANEARAGMKSCATNADCGGSQQCCSGTCVSFGDNNNCGGCGIVCSTGTTCKLVNFFAFGGKGHLYECVA